MQTILVCDDDKEIVEAIDIYLQQEGYQVLKAYDGEEALEILKEKEVHLLIIDVMMPRLDGIRATLKIREESSIPIIILSAKTEDADKILGLNIGRLCGKAVQSSGTGGTCKVAASPLYAAWQCGRERRVRIYRRRSVDQR